MTPRERATQALAALPITTTNDGVVVTVLSAALDPEELAHAFYDQGAWCGTCDFEGWDACGDCRTTCRDYAVKMRDHVLEVTP